MVNNDRIECVDLVERFAIYLRDLAIGELCANNQRIVAGPFDGLIYHAEFPRILGEAQ